MKTFAATWFIRLFFANQQLLADRHFSVTEAGYISTFHANGMQLGDIVCLGEQVWHLPEWFAQVVHIQAGNDDPYSLRRNRITNNRELIIEKLGFVDPDNIRFGTEPENTFGMIDRSRGEDGFVVRHDLHRIVSRVYGWLEDLDPEVGNLCPL